MYVLLWNAGRLDGSLLIHDSVPCCTRPSKSDANLGWRGEAEVRPCEGGGVTWAELCSSLESSTAFYEIYHALNFNNTMFRFFLFFLIFWVLSDLCTSCTRRNNTSQSAQVSGAEDSNVTWSAGQMDRSGGDQHAISPVMTTYVLRVKRG